MRIWKFGRKCKTKIRHTLVYFASVNYNWKYRQENTTEPMSNYVKKMKKTKINKIKLTIYLQNRVKDSVIMSWFIFGHNRVLKDLFYMILDYIFLLIIFWKNYHFVSFSLSILNYPLYPKWCCPLLLYMNFDYNHTQYF